MSSARSLVSAIAIAWASCAYAAKPWKVADPQVDCSVSSSGDASCSVTLQEASATVDKIEVRWSHVAASTDASGNDVIHLSGDTTETYAPLQSPIVSHRHITDDSYIEAVLIDADERPLASAHKFVLRDANAYRVVTNHPLLGRPLQPIRIDVQTPATEGRRVTTNPSPAAAGVTIRGHVLYSDLTLGPSGFVSTVDRPARFVLISLQSYNCFPPYFLSSCSVGTGFTDENGYFSVTGSLGSWPLLVDQYATVYVGAMNDAGRVTDGSVDRIYLWEAKTAFHVTSDPYDIGTFRVGVADGAGILNILDVLRSGWDYARSAIGITPPKVLVVWRPSVDIGTFYTSNSTPPAGCPDCGGTIYLRNQGTTAGSDTDEFDDQVILHEYGHHVEKYASCNTSAGEAHVLCGANDARLAWSEGFADYFSVLASVHSPAVDLYSTDYIDTIGTLSAGSSARLLFNVEDNATCSQASYSPDNEAAIALALWDLGDSAADVPDRYSAGENAILSIVKNDLPGSASCDVSGFIQAWCGHYSGDSLLFKPILDYFNLPTVSPCFQSPPTTTTVSATSVAATSATLNAKVNPNGVSTTTTFEYGPTTSYGSSVAGQTLTGSTEQNVSVAVQNLACNSLVHYRVRATNSGGTATGADTTFTTSACVVLPPSAETRSATAIDATSATLNGAVNSNGAATATAFDYGVTSSYGNTVTAQSLTGATSQIVTAQLSTLTCNTLYHYRVRASNAGGAAFGADTTFTTAPCAVACYSLLVNTEPSVGSLVTASPPRNCSGGYLPGSTITLQISVPKGYDFLRWSGNGGTFSSTAANPTTFVITAPATVTANFQAWPAGRLSSLLLVSGSMNGQVLGSSQRTVSVTAGIPVIGSLTVEINSTFAANSTMSFATTRSWGAHASSFSDLGRFDSPVSGLKRVVSYNFVAPATPGTYYVILAYAAEKTASNLMSCTSSAMPGAVWDNGDDIAGWNSGTIDNASTNGTVLVNFLDATGKNVPTWIPATAIKLVVASTKHRAAGH